MFKALNFTPTDQTQIQLIFLANFSSMHEHSILPFSFLWYSNGDHQSGGNWIRLELTLNMHWGAELKYRFIGAQAQAQI